MQTPAGIIGIASLTTCIVSFSVMATYFDGEKEESYKKQIAAGWPFFRDWMKGWKNAYKGWRSAMAALIVLHIDTAAYLVVPVGILAGALASSNRFWLRDIVEKRKVQMNANNNLLREIQKEPFSPLKPRLFI